MKIKIYKERHIYFFICNSCKHQRQSYKRAKARRGYCRNCRNVNILDNQPSLFQDFNKRPDLDIFNILLTK